MQKLLSFWCTEKAAAVLPRVGAEVIFYYRFRERYYRFRERYYRLEQYYRGYFRGYFRSGPKTRHKSSGGRHGCNFLVPLASSSTATLSSSTATPSGSTVRSSGTTAPTVFLAFLPPRCCFSKGFYCPSGSTAPGAVVPLCAGCEHNGWIFSHL